MTRELLLLPADRVWAQARIAELEQAILALGPEFYEVFNQSSETWHDNAPFDALRDRQSVLDAELQSLKRTLRASAPSLPRQPKTKVGIGSCVTLVTGAKYLVAGDWTPHAGQMIEGCIVVSRLAPLATALVGKKVGDAVQVGRTRTVIEAIETAA